MTLSLEEIEELGRRAVACKHWRWLPGMAYVHEEAGEDGPCWQDCTAFAEECGGGQHWVEDNAEEYPAWRLPEPVYTYKDSRWACYAESVLRGGRTVDLPRTKFNPFDIQGADYVGGFDDRTAIGFPDFTDPATLGCLLALVREACGNVVAYRCRRVNATVEAEALVAALEAAP